MPKKHIYVVGAVIVDQGRVLCAQRSAGALAGLWEFPGGKIEPGETARDALQREIAEELGCAVEVGDGLERTTCEYAFGTVTLTTFYCEIVKGTPQSTEHAEIRWCTPDEMAALSWARSDISTVAKIQSSLPG